MSIITRADLEARWGVAQVAALSTRDWPDDYSETQQEADRTANINNCIAAAEAYVISKLEKRYVVSGLAEYPQVVIDLFRGMALVELAKAQQISNLAPESEWNEMLKDINEQLDAIRDGKESITGLVTQEEANSFIPVSCQTDGERLFSRDKRSGF